MQRWQIHFAEMMMQRQNYQGSTWQALPKIMLAENRHNGRKNQSVVLKTYIL